MYPPVGYTAVIVKKGIVFASPMRALLHTFADDRGIPL
jgi:hypothetical protein